MIALGEPSAEFPGRHNQGIDFAPETVLNRVESVDDFLEPHFTDDKEIKIAFVAGRAPSERAVNEHNGDPFN